RTAREVGEELWGGLAEGGATVGWGVAGGNYTIRRCDGGEQSRAALADPEFAYRETVSPPCVLWIAGAGHIAQAVAPLALQLDFKVTVFDDRPALANSQFFPGDVILKTDVWENLLPVALPPAPPS